MTFKAGANGALKDPDANTSYVKKDTNKKFGDITKPETTPDSGYKFDKWSIEDTKLIDQNLAVTASFIKVSQDPDAVGPVDPNDKPNPDTQKYYTVTFRPGDHGTIGRENTVYVLISADKKFVDIPKATVSTDAGYNFTGWDISDNTVINRDMTATAQYDKKSSSGGGGGSSKKHDKKKEPDKKTEEPVTPVPDKDKEHKAEPVIKYVSGYDDGTFKPQGLITRAEAATMLSRLLTKDQVPNGSAYFSDLVPNQWYQRFVAYVTDRDFMIGYPDGSFGPNKNITRAEFAQMIYKYTDGDETTPAPFEDIKSHWAYKAITKAYNNEYIKGYPDGTFKPDQFITRAEAVTVLNKAFNRSTNGKNLTSLKNSADMSNFADINDFWAYYEILDASNTRLQESDTKDWTEIIK